MGEEFKYSKKVEELREEMLEKDREVERVRQVLRKMEWEEKEKATKIIEKNGIIFRIDHLGNLTRKGGQECYHDPDGKLICNEVWYGVNNKEQKEKILHQL